RRGAGGDRRPGELVAVPVLAPHAEEERSRPHLARVVCQLGDLHRSSVHDLGRAERRDEALQIHPDQSSLWGLRATLLVACALVQAVFGAGGAAAARTAAPKPTPAQMKHVVHEWSAYLNAG